MKVNNRDCFLITNFECELPFSCKREKFGNFFIRYNQSYISPLDKVEDRRNELYSSLETSVFLNKSSSDINTRGFSIVNIKDKNIDIITSTPNLECIYYFIDRKQNRFAIFNEFLLAGVVLNQLGVNIVYDYDKNQTSGETIVNGIGIFHPSKAYRLSCDASGLSLTCEDLPDYLNESNSFPYADLNESGDMIWNLLLESIKKEINLKEGHRYASLLSSGVDSGAVSFIAARHNIIKSTYSIGSLWGDEFEGAQKLAELLGLQFVPITLTQNNILEGLCHAISWMGTSNKTIIDINVSFQCFFKNPSVNHDVFFTGYGNDLINGGLYTTIDSNEQFQKNILNDIKKTRYSNEFSNRCASFYNKRLVHPYWDRRLIQDALKIHPSLKVKNGREKFFFRKKYEEYVPYELAWKEKKAVHTGGGLEAGTNEMIDRITGMCNSKQVFYNKLFEHIFNDSTNVLTQDGGHERHLDAVIHNLKREKK